jgi:hypothetical protein
MPSQPRALPPGLYVCPVSFQCHECRIREEGRAQKKTGASGCLLRVHTGAILLRLSQGSLTWLDMYACTTTENIRAADFPTPENVEEIFYWRKHPNLHGWMEALYKDKGGEDTDFNLSPLRLDTADLDALEKAVSADELPHTEGFFFGVSQPEEKERTLALIGLAREAIASGKRVFYYAWW